MKRIAVVLLGLGLGSAPLWAMPSQITFQGTLKQKGSPVNGTRNMQFSFVDASGASIPGTVPVPVANVQVINGLFAVQLPLDPTIPWEQYTPFIQVSIEGQILSPNQPINASLYAAAAIPQGLIAMFLSSCPVGWTSVPGLTDRVPMGGGNKYAIGSYNDATTHTHTGTTSLGTNTEVTVSPVGTPTGAQGGAFLEDVANQFNERANTHSHTFTTDPGSSRSEEHTSELQ